MDEYVYQDGKGCRNRSAKVLKAKSKSLLIRFQFADGGISEETFIKRRKSCGGVYESRDSNHWYYRKDNRDNPARQK